MNPLKQPLKRGWYQVEPPHSQPMMRCGFMQSYLDVAAAKDKAIRFLDWSGRLDADECFRPRKQRDEDTEAAACCCSGLVSEHGCN